MSTDASIPVSSGDITSVSDFPAVSVPYISGFNACADCSEINPLSK